MVDGLNGAFDGMKQHEGDDTTKHDVEMFFLIFSCLGGSVLFLYGAHVFVILYICFWVTLCNRMSMNIIDECGIMRH